MIVQVGSALAHRAIPLQAAYLAKTAFAAQQIDGMPVDPDRPENLYEPVPRLAATRGIFDRQARRRTAQLWATTHHPALVAALAGLAAVAARVRAS